MRRWFAMHRDFQYCVEQMTDREAGAFIKALFKALDGEEFPPDSPRSSRVALTCALLDADACRKELTDDEIYD